MEKTYLIRLSLLREGHTVSVFFLSEAGEPVEYADLELAKHVASTLASGDILDEMFPDPEDQAGLSIYRPHVVECTTVFEVEPEPA